VLDDDDEALTWRPPRRRRPHHVRAVINSILVIATRPDRTAVEGRTRDAETPLT